MLLVAALVVLSGLAACSSDEDDEHADADPAVQPGDGATPPPGRPLHVPEAPGLLPFPNDRYTTADDSTDTGLRLDLAPELMPVNLDGVPVDPTAWNQSDGFSPGGPLVLELPRVDLEASGAPPITDIASSLDVDSPIVLVDADTGERQPFWAEVDTNVPDGADEAPLVFLRPARNLLEGHRYVVGVQGMVDHAGQPLALDRAFSAWRDNLPTEVPEVEDHRDAMDQVFADLAEAGLDRADLEQAWGFTVGSERNLTERMLHIRDEAFAELGDAAPTFEVLSVAEQPEDGVYRRVDGTIEVPLYLTGEGEPGESFNGVEAVGDLPAQNGTFDVGFLCTVPDAALDEPALPALYGHGLLGSRGEVAGAAVPIGDEGVAACAVDWIGMAEEDAGNVARTLQDMGGFHTVADRLQQGFLDFLWLGRAMTHEDGLVSDPAFQGPDGQPLLDAGELVFVGNSQGGILGGGLTAVAQDWTRAVLGVPAMSYSTLLDRSVDYEPYAPIMAEAYPARRDQVLNLALAQVLWDRGEANGYVHHLTDDPLPDTPDHQVLLFEAFGDHQVHNIATENQARSMTDLRLADPGLEEGRHPSEDPWFGIEALGALEEGETWDGSVLVVWDFGTPTWPLGNVPNDQGDDPHGEGRDVDAVVTMVADFLRGGFTDPCGDDPCAGSG